MQMCIIRYVSLTANVVGILANNREELRYTRVYLRHVSYQVAEASGPPHHEGGKKKS